MNSINGDGLARRGSRDGGAEREVETVFVRSSRVGRQSPASGPSRHVLTFFTFTRHDRVRLIAHADHVPPDAVAASRVERVTCATAGSGFVF